MSLYTTRVITLFPESSISEALFLMRKNKIKRIVIVNEEKNPVGIVTERDIGKFLQKDTTSRMLSQIHLNEIMSRNLFTISSDQDEILLQCAIRMDAFQISSIVIVDDGKLSGIVTKSDLVKNYKEFSGIYKVKDYMNTKIVTCRKSDSLLFTLNILNKNKVSSLVVTDNNGSPVGIISYDNFLKRSEYFKLGLQNTREYLLSNDSAKKLRASDLIGSKLLTIESDDDLTKAARLMSEYKISGIPVVDRNRNLEGLISGTDIIRAYHEAKIHGILQHNDPHCLN